MLDISKNVNLMVRVKAIQAAAEILLGEQPEVQYGADHVRLVFSPMAKQKIQNWIIQALTAQPGEIRVQGFDILAYPIAKVYGKWAAIGLFGAYLLGRGGR